MGGKRGREGGSGGERWRVSRQIFAADLNNGTALLPDCLYRSQVPWINAQSSVKLICRALNVLKAVLWEKGTTDIMARSVNHLTQSGRHAFMLPTALGESSYWNIHLPSTTAFHKGRSCWNHTKLVTTAPVWALRGFFDSVNHQHENWS